jgi:hypothetical protein
MKFCFEKLPSHTSHKLQPCDVGAFRPLKTAYREQVEQLYRKGANTVGKQHFTLLYSRARNLAFTSQNIKSGWSQARLYPFDPDRVLSEIQKPQAETIVPQTTNMTANLVSHNNMLRTPVTYESLTHIQTMIKQGTALNSPSKHRFQKLANAAEKAFADRAILLDENKLLFEQNNEKTTRSSTKSTVTGTAKIMAYDDIVEAQRKRDVKESTAAGVKKASRKRQDPPTGECKRPRLDELEYGRREIKALGLEDYCSVLRF